MTSNVHHAGVFLYVIGLLEVHSDTINEFSIAVLHRLLQVTSKVLKRYANSTRNISVSLSPMSTQNLPCLAATDHCVNDTKPVDKREFYASLTLFHTVQKMPFQNLYTTYKHHHTTFQFVLLIIGTSEVELWLYQVPQKLITWFKN